MKFKPWSCLFHHTNLLVTTRYLSKFTKIVYLRFLHQLLTLFYCSSVWSNDAKKNVNKLQLVQNFAGRIVVNKRKYDPVTPLLKSLNWLSVKDQLYFKDAVLAFKCMSGLAPGYLSDQLITRSNVSNRKTRNSQMV